MVSIPRWVGGLAGLFLLVLTICGKPAGASHAPDELWTEIEHRLNTIERPLAYVHDPRIAEAIVGFYEDRAFSPIWVDRSGFTDRGRILFQVLGLAGREGLEPADYDLTRIGDLVAWARPDALADSELLLSASLLRYAADLRTGRVAPSRADPELFAHPHDIDRAAILVGAAAVADLASYLGELAPTGQLYRSLRDGLHRYQVLAARGWPTVPAGPWMRVGDSDPRVLALRRRLAATGELTMGGSDSPLFDAEVEAALRLFQSRNGLEVDGVVGPATLAALNESPEDRIRRILLNMERARWMPEDLGDRHVLVNMAGFELEAAAGGEVRLDMKVVVGRPYRRTPVFSDRITYLELNPYWHVPPRIAALDIVPKVRANPNYLREQGIRVFSGWGPQASELDPAGLPWQELGRKNFPYRLRQEPGSLNALGRIKFMFPNRFNVYLHDTPSRELFERTVRTFSSGCIRVEKPLELGAFLLDGTRGWDQSRLEKEISTGRTQVVRLNRPVPIHLTYQTVWVAADGSVQFRDDIYGRDRRLAAALYGAAAPRQPR